MVADGGPVTGLAVQRAAEPGPGGGNGWAGADRAEAQGGAGRPETVGDARAGQFQALLP